MRRILFFNKIFLFLLLIAAKHSVAATITVCASGCDYATIQAAINNAISGDVVSVSAGTYSENITFAAAADNITVQGAGAATTLIQGVSGVDSRVVTFSGSTTTSATVLDGFTIDNQHYYDHTGGINILSGASPTLRNLKVSGNSLRNSGADHFGGGIKVVDSGVTIVDSLIGGVGAGNFGDMGGGGIYATSTDASKAVVIINTEISYNSTGGGGGGISATNYAGTVTITDSLISYNTNTTSSGGGAVCRTCASMEFINTNVDNNSNTAAYSTNRGGGIAVAQGGVVTFTNGSISGNISNRASGGINVQGAGSTFTADRCKISGNRAGSNDGGGGVSILEGASTALTNCMITGNTTGTNYWSSGGGVLVGNGTAVIDHCTISGNWSNKTGGGVDSGVAGTTTITNSLLWGNISKDAGTWDIFQSGGPITAVHYSAVGSGQNYAGSNNITAITGTVFVAPDPSTSTSTPKITGDYHLKPDAVEAINTADPASTVTEDFDGESRPAGTQNEMGADEIATPVPSFDVTKTADTNDGSCDVDDCSLREAVKAANDAAGLNQINVPAGIYTITITDGTTGDGDDTNALGDFDITDDVKIVGAGSGSTIIQAATGSGLANHRIFDVTSSGAVIIEAMTVRFGYVREYGGCIYAAGDITIKDSIIDSCTIYYTNNLHGGGIYSGGELTMENSTVSNNKSKHYGGGISISGGTLTDVTFTNNQSEAAHGGAIYNSTNLLTINGSTNTFTGNYGRTTQADFGGSIYSTGSLTISNTAFTGRSGTKDAGRGGAIYLEDTTDVLTLSDSSFTDLGAYIDGGAIRMNGGTMSNVTFTDNQAEVSHGGAIANYDNLLIITGSNAFDGNNAGTTQADFGGSIYSSGSLTISNTTFTGRSSTRDAGRGGAIYLLDTGDVLTLSDSSFTDLQAYIDGGAIRMNGGTMSNVTFTDNQAEGNHGGAVANYTNPLTITGTNSFDGNRAGPDWSDFGGSIYSSGNLTISNTAFAGRNDGATDAGRGGAIYAASNLDLSTSTFKDFKDLQQGGAINMLTGSIDNSTFSNNKSNKYGGAIFSNSSCTVKNSTFSNNTATTDGDTIYGTTTVYNSIITSDTDLGSMMCSGVTSGDYNLQYNGSCFTALANDLTGDPLLSALANNGGPTQTHALQLSSPAIDAASNAICAAAPVNNLDQRGGARPYGATCDIGAYEYGVIVNEAPVGGYTADNVIPTAQVSQSTSGDAIITINFRAKDADGDSVTLKTFQYSVDGGSVWSAPINGDASGALSVNWSDGGSSYNSAKDWTGTVHSFAFDAGHADVSGMMGVDQSDVQIRFRLNDGKDDSVAYVTSESFQVDDLAPTPAFVLATYIASTDTLTITGTQFTTLADVATEIKDQIDWSKLSWDIDGDSETTDVGFVVSDVSSLIIDSDTSMTLVLTSAKATAIEEVANYAATGGEDALDFTVGFGIDAAGNVSTTDAAANVPLYISEFPALIVTKSGDTDGNCTLLNCSLREAVKAANASPGASIIKFQASTNGSTIAITRAGTDDTNVNGDFDITNPVYIVGNGSGSTTISGDLLDRVFHVTNASAVTLDGVKVYDGAISEDGGCIYAASDITIRDGIVDNCTANASNGGAIYSGGVVTIDSSTMSNSTAGNNGGAIFTDGMTITNGTFQNNSAPNDGGAIYNQTNPITIDGSTFNGNRAGSDIGDFGGSIYSMGSLNISNTTFTGRDDGTADAFAGGAIYLLDTSDVLTLSDSSFSSLVAYGNGGAIHMNGGTMSNVTFTNNQSQYDDGGAITNITNLLTLTGTNTFEGNRAGLELGDFGGSIYSSGSLTIFNSTFTGRNDGAVDAYGGGAIYLLYPENVLTLSDSSFSSLVVFGSAGAIFMHGGTINNVTFTNNDAQYDDGGAIKNITNPVTITDTIFDGNRAGPELGDFGGSILSSGSLTISNTTFTGRNDGAVDAYVGGAIYLVDADDVLTLSDSSFSSLVAFGSAGAIFMQGGTINNVTFTDNDAQYDDGGAIKNITNPVTITDTIFDGNRAGPELGDFGGSIFSSGSLAISNTTFAGRDDGIVDAFNGGAIYSTGILNVANSTFSANRATARGGAIFQGADATIINATIYNSTAGTDGEAIYTGLATVRVENTIVAKSDASSSLCTGVISNGHNLQYNGTCFTAAANDISGQDPMLGALADNGGVTQTHALLSSASPAVDKGLDSTCAAAPVNNLDQRGVTRPIDGDAIAGAVCDIGAYEYAVADDPDHFLISHDGHGLYCGANEVITVTPKESVGSNYPRYNKTIVLDTQTGKGDWTLLSGAGVFSDATANDGLATYTFTGSEASTSFELAYQEGASTLDIDVYEQANSTIRDDDAEGMLTYLPSGFTITNGELFDPTTLPNDITTKNLAIDFTIHITAYGATANDTTCGIIEGYTGTKTLKFWSSATGVFTIDASAIAVTEGASVGQNVNFTDGKAQVVGNYDSTGSISFSVKDDTVTDPNLPTGIRGESNLFDVNAAWNTCSYETTPFACFNFYSLSDFSPLENTIEGTVGVAGTYAGSQMTLQNIGSQEFVLLVGGDATIGSGTQSGGYEGGKQDVGGDITYTGGAVLYNDVHSGGSITAVSGTTNIDGDVYAATTITEAGGTFGITGTQNPGTPHTSQLDFTVVSNYFKNFSTTVGAAANTTETTNNYGALSVTAVAGENVTSIDAATLLSAYRYTVTGPCDAVLYVNVTGSTTPTVDHTEWVYSGGIDKSHVLLNFPNASTLTLSNDNRVNMLAPYTTVTALGGWVQGNLIVGNMVNDNNVRLGHFTPTFDTCPPPGTLNYFQISHDEAGIHCTPEVITVTPKQADGTDFEGYTGTIVLDTQEGTGTWSTSAPGTLISKTDGTATYTFTGSENSVAFNLDYKSGDAVINIAVHDEDDPSLKDNDTEPDLTFSASGFTVTRDALNDTVDPIVINPIPAQIAGTAFDMHITAYGTTATDQTCGVIETYEGTPKLDFWYTLNNPTTGTISPTVDGTPITKAVGGTQVDVVFTAGRAVVPVNYKDVGQITINLLEAGASMLGTSQFVVRPADLVLSNIRRRTEAGNCAGEDGSMTITPLPSNPADYPDIPQAFVAGAPFCVTVTAVDSTLPLPPFTQLQLDNATTPNFGQEGESIKLTSTMVAAGGDQVNPPIVAPTGFTFNAGVATSSDISWGEVGIIKLSASIDDGNYLGTGDVTGTVSDGIGRFKPEDFLVENTRVPLFETACGAGRFSYVGQPFLHATKPGFTVTAQNASGITTRNYTGDWFKLKPETIPDPVYSDAQVVPNITVTGLAKPAIDDLGLDDPLLGGEATVMFDGDTELTYDRTSPIEPFNASIDFSVQIKDEDDVRASEYPFIIPLVVFNNDSNMVYGRVRIGNALGSELLDLNIPVVVERYVAGGFQLNADDACTDLTLTYMADPNPADALNVPDPGAAPCVREAIAWPGDSGLACTVPVATNVYVEPASANAALQGDYNVWLTAPGATGSLDLTTNGLFSWLMFDWNGDGNDDQPRGRASFGGYRGDDLNIFIQEVY